MTHDMRVMIVDEHEVVREGLVHALGSRGGFTPVCAVALGRESLAALERTQPDVVLLDLRLPDMSGYELCRRLRERRPAAKAVMLTSYLGEDAVRESLRAGAAGYVTKAAGLQALIGILRGLDGCSPQPRDADLIVRRLHQVAEARLGSRPEVSRHERILELAAAGLTNAEIGQRLYIAESTVRFHMQKLKVTTGARTRTELVAKAIRTGLLSLAPEIAVDV